MYTVVRCPSFMFAECSSTTMSTKKRQAESTKQHAVTILSLMKKPNDKLDDKIKRFIKKDKMTARRVFETDVDGWTPVHACALKGSKHLLKIMVSSGIDVNARMGHPEGLPGQCSLLHIAAYRGDIKVCKYLLSRGARVDIRDSCDRTPLYYAQTKQHGRVVELLKQRGGGASTVASGDPETQAMDECPTPQPTKLTFCFFPHIRK